jgi:sugar phosphate isomerase/epimerase
MNTLPLALQMYTLRDAMNADFARTARDIAEIGFTAVELAGYGNLTATEAAAALKEAGLRVTGMHASIGRLREDPGAVLAEAELFDSPFITCSAYPKDALQSGAQCEVAGEELDRIGALVRSSGRRFAFHNHGFDFEMVDGRLRIDWMLRASEARNLEMELDVYWSTAAGVDTVRWLRSNGARITQVHLKDEKELGASGLVDFPALFRVFEEIGAVESYIYEQEHYSFPPLDCARRAIEALRGWGKS